MSSVVAHAIEHSALDGRAGQALLGFSSARLADHALFTSWTDGPRPVRDRLLCLPALMNFAMGFRDINRWAFRFQTVNTALEGLINAHTHEDETHARLFLRDWQTLGLDGLLGWSASDTLEWLFLSNSTECSRRIGMGLLATEADDLGAATLRLARMEAIEACGELFFRRMAPLAAAWQAQGGAELLYLGPWHLSRETGALAGPPLPEPPLYSHCDGVRAAALYQGMLAQFDELFTSLHDTGLAVATAGAARAGFAQLRRRHAPPASGPADLLGPPVVVDGPVHASQAALQALLLGRMWRTAAHPFYAWLDGADVGLGAAQRLRRFVPMWCMDVMGYRDLNQHVLRYTQPVTALERAVNRWVADLETHSRLFLDDWLALGLDGQLGWGAGDLLRFCYLDPQMDVHRRNMVRFVQLAATHPDALTRLWLMHALESSGQAFFHHTARLARQAEADEDLALPYLANRHAQAHVPAASPRPEVVPVRFKALPMAAAPQATVAMLIDTVFDAIDQQLDLSLAVCRSGRFAFDTDPVRDTSHARPGR